MGAKTGVVGVLYMLIMSVRLVHSLRKDADLMSAIEETMKHLMDKGYIKRKVSMQDARQKIYEIAKLD